MHTSYLPMHENEISEIIIGKCLDIHKKYGPGLLESFYDNCLYNKLLDTGLKIERQKPIYVTDENIKHKKYYKIDFLVEDKVVVELKSVRCFAPVHNAQLLTYIKILNKKLGLLINFNRATLKEGIKRVVNGI